MAPGEHITLDGFLGLRLQATESKRSWIFRYKSPATGHMRQLKLGEWPAMSQASAIAEWERAKDLRDSGIDPSDARRDRRPIEATVSGDYTVRRLCNDYYLGHVERHRKPKGAKIVWRLFDKDKMIKPIADLSAESITRRQAFDLLESHAATPMLCAKLKAELGAAWDYALDAGRIPDSTPNWWRLVMRGRLRTKGRLVQGKQRVTKRVLSDAELGELVRWLPNFSRTLEDALTLYIWTGTRGAEIVSMEVSEITEESDGLWWTVPKVKTKNASRPNATDLRVPLVGRAKEIVLRRKLVARNGFLFPARDKGHNDQKLIQQSVYYQQPYSNNGKRDEQRESESGYKRPRLTVTNWAPHDLRRTVRTKLAELECPHEVGEAILGHVLPGVAGAYNRHSYDKQRREWLTLLSSTLEEIASLRPA